METGDLDDQIAGIASLAEPHRRNLYRYVASRRGAVSKDEAAEALGLARSVATFHLDRLVADGLLVAEFRRLSGRSGPGAGRPAKLYRRSDRQIAVHLPARRYALAAALLAAAVTTAVESDVPVDVALTAAAKEHGRRLGERVRGRVGRRTGRGAWIEAAITVLDEEGYEPRHHGSEVVMSNCPFHALVEDHRALVCGMNLDLLGALAEAAPDGVLTARLEPSDEHCCVRLKDS
jgi:predicted ArsR family transcriptional regulator